MACQFLDLPPELLIKVFLQLHPKDVLLWRLVNRAFRNLVDGSVELQLFLECFKSRVLDNKHSSLSSKERLDSIRKSDNAWRLMKPTFTKEVKIPLTPSGIYDLCGGIFFLGDQSRHAVHWLDLHEPLDEPVHWNRMDFDSEMIDLGISKYEHDLAAIVTGARNSNLTTDLRVELRQMTTGKPHPEAKDPIILVHQYSRSLNKLPSVGIEIVGDLMALVVTEPTEMKSDKLRVYDWRKGTCRLSFDTPVRERNPLDMYFQPTFISPTLLILPNRETNTLDFWDLSSSESTIEPYPSLCFTLPPQSAGSNILYISSRCDPNPQTRTYTGSATAKTPFFLEADDAVFICNMHVVHWMMHKLTLTVPRRSLLYSFYYYKSQYLNEPAGAPTDYERYIAGIFQRRIQTVLWDDWSEGNARLMLTDDVVTNWITITSGTRCVYLQEKREDANDEEIRTKVGYRILDFGKHRVLEMRRQRGDFLDEYDDPSQLDVSGPWIPGPWTLHDDEDATEAYGFDVYTRLPYLEYVLEDGKEVDYDGMLIDEENLIGLKLNSEGHIHAVDIMRFA